MPPEDFQIQLTRFCQYLAAQLPIFYRNCVRLLLFVGNLLLTLLAALLLLPSLWLIHIVSSGEYEAYLVAMLICSLICLMALGGILKAVPVLQPPPAGVRLKRHDAPELFTLLDEETKRAGCLLRVEQVWITPEYGLYSSQRRLFGFPVRHNLHIGLPLLQSMDKKHFRLLVAYQAAHLAAGYTGSNDEFSHHRNRWQQIAGVQENYALTHYLLYPFYQWFVPFFDVWVNALCRQQVLFCEQAAIQHHPLQDYTKALCQLHAYGYHFDHVYWPQYWEQADHHAKPTALPYAHFLANNVEKAEYQSHLNMLLDIPAYTNDTHPTLAWRLEMLQIHGRLPDPNIDDIALKSLGKATKTVINAIDARWWRENANMWQARFADAQIARAKLTRLNDNAANLDVDTALERAWLTEWLDRQPEAALAQLQGLYQNHPDHPHVLFAYARQLLKQNQSDGLPLLEQAMILDPDCRAAAAELQATYHRRNGRFDAAAHFDQLHETEKEIDFLAETECQEWHAQDTLSTPNLDDQALQAWLNEFIQQFDFHELYIARRILKHRPHRMVYAIGYVLNPKLKRRQMAEIISQINHFLENQPMPHPCHLICLNHGNRDYMQTLQQVASSRLR